MKTVSFFSYKGGAGRSTLAFNVIPILANEFIKPTKNKPIIIVDTDVDSCGMSYLLQVPKEQITAKNCVQYLLETGCDSRRYSSVSEHPLLSKLIPVGNVLGYPENEAVLLLPAKDGMKIGETSYSDKDAPFSKKLENFIDACEYIGVSAIIFDSAVGNQATANISNEASDIIVCCMRPTTQFTDGTLRYLLSLENMGGADDPGKFFSRKQIVLVPNVIPRGETTINGAHYPDTALAKINNNFKSKFVNDFTNHEYHFEMLSGAEFGIPAVDRFMWCEDILYTQASLSEDEEIALQRYKKLARVIYEI